MNIENLLKEAADSLSKMAELQATPVIVEDLGDVSNKIEAEIGKTARCILVGFGGSTPVKQGKSGEDMLVDSVKLVVSCFEKPAVNRKTEGVPTLLAMAQAVRRELTGAKTKDMSSVLFYRGITPIAELTGGRVSCDVIFDTKDTL